MDKFIETYIGRYGRKHVFNNLSKYDTIKLKLYSDNDVIELIGDLIKFLEKDIPGEINDTDLLNIRDDLLGDVNQVKYLFTLK